MAEKRHQQDYPESLLQWVWAEQQFEIRHTTTDGGKSLFIENPGVLNHGEGPDFLGARMKIGPMIWHGDVELHIHENDWYTHKHHTNSHFDSVILHVYLRRSLRRAKTSDGFSPHNLYLAPFLQKQLYQLFIRKQLSHTLPCSGNIKPIHPGIFQQQVERVHREYFEYKVDELLEEYPSGQPLSQAWKKSLIVKLYETLGVSGNAAPMKTLAGQACRLAPLSGQFSHFVKQVEDLAGLHRKNHWKRSGIRPASYPEIRIKQAAALHYVIHHTDFEDVIRKQTTLWTHWMNAIDPDDHPGNQMKQILYTTVFLPALYLAGKLLHSGKLKQAALDEWTGFEIQLPESVLKPFREAGFPVDRVQKAGLAHQLKRYCKMRNCHRCELFKNAIHS